MSDERPESAKKMAKEIALSLAGMSAPSWLVTELKEWEHKIRADAIRKGRRGMTNPSLSLLVKLGSIIVHVDEMLSPTGQGTKDSGTA